MELQRRLDEQVQKQNTTEAQLFQVEGDRQQQAKVERELRQQNEVLGRRVDELKGCEQELMELKQQVNDLDQIVREREVFKQESEQLNQQSLTLQQKISDLMTQVEGRQLEKDELRRTIEHLNKLNAGYQRQVKRLEKELLEAQTKLDLLMDLGVRKLSVKKSQQVIAMERVRQVFVEEKEVLNQVLKFNELVFARAGEAHLTVALWVRVGHHNSSLPLIRVMAQDIKLLELGIHLDQGNVYATYYSQQQQQ